MQKSEIRAVFSRTYNGKPNFMTPSVLEYGKRGAHLFEVSSGRGIQPHTHIYGVIVITICGKKRHDLSQCFDSLADALAYAETLPRAESPCQ